MEPHQLSLFVLIPIPILAGCLICWARRRTGPPQPAEAAGEHGRLKKCTLRSIPVELYDADGAAAAADVCAIYLGEFADGEKVRVLELYGADGAATAADVCAICLGEFADGEKVRVLVVA